MNIKMGFVTCVQLGLSCLEEIYRIGGQVEILITLKDESAKKKSGRIYLQDFAENHQLPLLKIDDINETIVQKTIKEMKLDWLFIIGWSQIAKKEILSAPRLGCIGIHPTLLPEGRGRASIPWAIVKQLPETGVTLFRLDEGVDTGDIIGQEHIYLDDKITATELYEKVQKAHVTLITNYWDEIAEGSIMLSKQDEKKATEWPKRGPEDGEIKKEMSVDEALTLIRATTKPYPGAYMNIDGEKWIVWSANRSANKTNIKLSDGYIEPTQYTVQA